MRDSWKRHSIWVCAVIIAGTCLRTTLFADSNGSEPVLVFRIFNATQVPSEIVDEARKYVEHIYKDSGIHTEWLVVNKSQPFSLDPNSLELTIVLAPESFAQTQGLDDKNTGFALSNDGQGARRAYVFADRAAQKAYAVSQKREIKVAAANALILGHVIAHEAGHLMLPLNSHSQTGIMKPQMDMQSMDEARSGCLLFTKSQSELIRTALLKQTGR